MKAKLVALILGLKLVVEGSNTRKFLSFQEFQGGTAASAAVSHLEDTTWHLDKTWRQRQQPQQPQPRGEAQQFWSILWCLQQYSSKFHVSCNAQLLTYLLPCLRCHTSCRLWQCHRLTREVTRWIHTEHHWTNLSRPNSNLVAPPITVTVPAPVASTTASISFFLSCLAELSLSPLVPSNLWILHLSRASMAFYGMLA